MTQKNYPQDITNEINLISVELTKIFTKNKSNLRTVAKFSGMSVNSVKSVLAGKTANIGSYCMIAKALGTTLTDVIYTMKATEAVTSKVAMTGEATKSTTIEVN